MTLKKMLILGISALSLTILHRTVAQENSTTETPPGTTISRPNPLQEVKELIERPRSVRPHEVKFKNNEEMLNWQPNTRPDDDINRCSVPLAAREKGHIINPLASKEGKVQVVSLMNSKLDGHASTGGSDFKAYAFDYWQYVDSMVFWDGPVPSPDVMDAAHRNGVPIYGTLFFNWSQEDENDINKFLDFIKQDPDGSFPMARKIVDIAQYYGFDGYFINQETTGNKLGGKAEQMRQFMLYAKKYAIEKGYPIFISWYDAMSNSGHRNHINGVSLGNDLFVQPDKNGISPADHFFVNFNWDSYLNDQTVEHMKKINRNPFDAYAGFELQQNSYHTNIRREDLLDKNKKLKLSIGLYTPDSILGLAKDGADYHEQERYFWVGPDGNPKTSDDSKHWSGIARFVGDKTPITTSNFNTYFNTGHGKQWFIGGKVSKKDSWNYRSVAEVLPTWRWWIEAKQTPLKGRYDFDDALNGGNSITFEGVAENRNDIMLYATNFTVNSNTKLKLAHKGGQGTDIKVAVSTDATYKEGSFHEFNLTNSGDSWRTDTFDLSTLTGQKIYAIKLIVNGTGQNNFKFNLGQLAIFENDATPEPLTDVEIKNQRLFNAQDAEAIIQFEDNSDSDYYEVYQLYGQEWQIITASSNNTIYLPHITRPNDSTGTKQQLKVVAVAKNGQRSEATTVDFDWKLETKDTTPPKPQAENVVLGAVVTHASHPKTGSEGEEFMLNGTITGNSDKWCIPNPQASVDIKLTKPRNVKRWVVEHAGAGGESVNDGLMNTRDFELYYKDMESGEWELAHEVRGNIAHVTDIALKTPVTAQEWRLHVTTSHNGTKWPAIRIYNWKMYEELDTDTINIPMSQAYAEILDNKKLLVTFTGVKKGLTLNLYKDPQGKELLVSKTSTKDGTLEMPEISIENLGDLIYYRAKEEGKAESNTLAIRFRESKPVDKQPLKDALASFEAIEKETKWQYATSSIKEEVTKAIETIKALLGLDSVTQEEITQAVDTLNGLLAKLDGDKNYEEALKELQVRYDKGKAIQKPSQNLQDSLKMAKEALEKKNLSLEQIKALIAKIDYELLASTEKAISDTATKVRVHLTGADTQKFDALRVKVIKDEQRLANLDYDLYNIELLDTQGQPFAITSPARVFLPIAKDKKVDYIFYLPEKGDVIKLPHLQVGEFVDFSAEHFSHYGIVYAKKDGPKLQTTTSVSTTTAVTTTVESPTTTTVSTTSVLPTTSSTTTSTSATTSVVTTTEISTTAKAPSTTIEINTTTKGATIAPPTLTTKEKTKKKSLPNTGSINQHLFVIIGLGILVISAGSTLVNRKK